MTVNLIRLIGRKYPVLEETSLDDTRFVVSQLATALLLGPKFAAHSLPAVPGGTCQSVVLATARAWAGCAAVRAALVVRLLVVRHGIIAHGWSSGRGERVTHASRATATRVVGQCIASTVVARCNTSRLRARRSRLGVKPRMGKGSACHEACR
jgi:hypothetical protein